MEASGGGNSGLPSPKNSISSNTGPSSDNGGTLSTTFSNASSTSPSSSSSACSPFLGEEKDKPEKDYALLEKSVIKSIRDLRTDDEMCDVTFLVGISPASRVEIKANSTILSLRSPYFKTMCFGVMKNPNKPKIIDDLEPDIFQKVLAFIHAEEKCLKINSMEEAWTLRYAASQYLMSDLVKLCEDYLELHLTYKNGLTLLEQASCYKADDFKKKIYKVIKNRHGHVLSSPEVKQLEINDLISLLKLYKEVSADLVIAAIRSWGSALDEAEFKQLYKSRLFAHIQWRRLTNQTMLELHKEAILPLELENKAMVEILGRTEALPNEDSKAVCSVDLELTRAPCQRVHSIYSPCSCSGGSVSRIVLQTIRRSRSFFQSKSGTGPIVIYHDGMRMFQDVLKNKQLMGVAVDSDDIEVKYSFNYNGKINVTDLKARVFSIRVDQQDIFYFILEFDPIDLDRNSSPGGLKCPDKLTLEVTIAPELLKDLSDNNLLRTEVLSELPILETTSYPFQMTTKIWQTVMNGQIVLNNEMKDQKFFFVQGDVPIFGQIN